MRGFHPELSVWIFFGAFAALAIYQASNNSRSKNVNLLPTASSQQRSGLHISWVLYLCQTSNCFRCQNCKMHHFKRVCGKFPEKIQNVALAPDICSDDHVCVSVLIRGITAMSPTQSGHKVAQVKITARQEEHVNVWLNKLYRTLMISSESTVLTAQLFL